MSYWDTSTLVKLYAKEVDSAAFEVPALNDPGQAITSRIARYEAHATSGRKQAEGAIVAGAAQKLYNELPQDVAAGEILQYWPGDDESRHAVEVLRPGVTGQGGAAKLE